MLKISLKNTALLQGVCATLNKRIQALKLYIFISIAISRHSFEGCYFGAIMGSAKN